MTVRSTALYCFNPPGKEGGDKDGAGFHHGAGAAGPHRVCPGDGFYKCCECFGCHISH